MKPFFLLLSGIIMLVGCNNTETPASTVSKYLKAIDNFEFEKANALLVQNKENQTALANVKAFAASLDETGKQELISKGKNRQYNIIEKEVAADKALIIATNNEGTFTSVITFELIKDKGKWLIKSFKPDVG